MSAWLIVIFPINFIYWAQTHTSQLRAAFILERYKKKGSIQRRIMGPIHVVPGLQGDLWLRSVSASLGS